MKILSERAKKIQEALLFVVENILRFISYSNEMVLEPWKETLSQFFCSSDQLFLQNLSTCTLFYISSPTEK